MRTAAQVESDIDTARDALILADLVQDWDTGDAALEQLRVLWAEYAQIPHQRPPSDSARPGASY